MPIYCEQQQKCPDLLGGGEGLIFGGLRYTFYSIALFVFLINRIRQSASHTNLLVYLGII